MRPILLTGKNGLPIRDLKREIAVARADLKRIKPPPRAPWRGFPDAVLLAPESVTTKHPLYAAAKSGEAVAAAGLVSELVQDGELSAVRNLIFGATTNTPSLVSANAYERQGYNAIPSALAKLLGERIGLRFDSGVGQINVVGHTGADGYGRLARQAAFVGRVEGGRDYVMVDDFIGQGGTMANLRGWVERQGGNIVAAVALAGKPHSARLNPTDEQLNELAKKHGREFEKWWRELFGHAFDCLTHSEARYLARSPDVDTIRNRLAHKMRGGGGQVTQEALKISDAASKNSPSRTQRRSNSVGSEKTADASVKGDAENFSASPSIDLLAQMIGPSPAPRMLTKTEFALLRKCAEEVAQVTQEFLERSERKSKG